MWQLVCDKVILNFTIMTFKSLFVALTALAMSVAFTSCDKEEDDTFLSEPETPAVTNLSASKLDKYLTTTDYDGVSFRVRFTNGG